MDWAVNEQCYQYNECNYLDQVINQGKPVFQIEYGGQSKADSICPQANAAGFSGLIKNMDLDEFEIPCWSYAYLDTDEDGVLDYTDNCFNVSNLGQEDSDFDGFGNVCDCNGVGHILGIYSL